MVGLATKEVEDDTLAFNEIFAKRLEETRDGRYEENGDCEKRKREQKEEEKRWELGMDQSSSHATPQNQPLFPV